MGNKILNKRQRTEARRRRAAVGGLETKLNTKWLVEHWKRTLVVCGDDSEKVLRVFANRVLMSFGDRRAMFMAFDAAHKDDRVLREAQFKERKSENSQLAAFLMEHAQIAPLEGKRSFTIEFPDDADLSKPESVKDALLALAKTKPGPLDIAYKAKAQERKAQSAQKDIFE